MPGIGSKGAEILKKKAQLVGFTGSNIQESMDVEKARELNRLLDKQAEAIHQAKVEAEDLPIPVNNTAADLLSDEVVMPVLDYTRGYARTGLGALMGQAKKEDLYKTLLGHAPSVVEYVNRSGIPKGPPLSTIYPEAKDQPYDVTPVGAAAGLADMFLSPKNIRGALGKLLPAEQEAAQTAASLRKIQAAKMAAIPESIVPTMKDRAIAAKNAAVNILKSWGGGNPLSDATEKLSTKLYNSYFSQMDLELAAQGKGPVSEILYQNGVRGTAKQIPLQAERVLETKLGPQIGAVEDEALSKIGRAKQNIIANGGNTPPGTEVPTENLLRESKKTLARDFTTSKTNKEKLAIRTVLRDIKNIEQGPYGEPVDSIATEDYIKFKRAQQKLGKFQQDARSSFESPYRRLIGVEGAKDLENIFDEIEPGLGGKYHTANSRFGSLQTALPDIEKTMAQESNRPITSLHRGDIPFGGGMLLYGEGNVPLALGAAAAGRTIMSPWGSTTLGYWGRKAAELSLPDAATHGYSLFNDNEKKFYGVE